MTEDKEQSNNFLWGVALAFLLLAAVFIFGLLPGQPTIIKNASVPEKYFSTQPVRATSLKAATVIEGEHYACNDCHDQIFPSEVQKSYFSAHPDVILDHGVNNYCLTCHSLNNRDMLVDIHKNNIPFSQSEKTCLQCHGPIYRDWEEGVHGRMYDSWNKDARQTDKFTCVQCHNPHTPKFAPMAPSPGPKMENYQGFLKSISKEETPHG